MNDKIEIDVIGQAMRKITGMRIKSDIASLLSQLDMVIDEDIGELRDALESAAALASELVGDDRIKSPGEREVAEKAKRRSLAENANLMAIEIRDDLGSTQMKLADPMKRDDQYGGDDYADRFTELLNAIDQAYQIADSIAEDMNPSDGDEDAD